MQSANEVGQQNNQYNHINKTNIIIGNRGTIETRLRQYTDTTENLEKQLAAMERDVRNIQCDLRGVQRERQHLEQHRRKATTPAQSQEKSHTCSPPSLTTVRKCKCASRK